MCRGRRLATHHTIPHVFTSGLHHFHQLQLPYARPQHHSYTLFAIICHLLLPCSRSPMSSTMPTGSMCDLLVAAATAHLVSDAGHSEGSPCAVDGGWQPIMPYLMFLPQAYIISTNTCETCNIRVWDRGRELLPCRSPCAPLLHHVASCGVFCTHLSLFPQVASHWWSNSSFAPSSHFGSSFQCNLTALGLIFQSHPFF